MKHLRYLLVCILRLLSSYIVKCDRIIAIFELSFQLNTRSKPTPNDKKAMLFMGDAQEIIYVLRRMGGRGMEEWDGQERLGLNLSHDSVSIGINSMNFISKVSSRKVGGL